MAKKRIVYQIRLSFTNFIPLCSRVHITQNESDPVAQIRQISCLFASFSYVFILVYLSFIHIIICSILRYFFIIIFWHFVVYTYTSFSSFVIYSFCDYFIVIFRFCTHKIKTYSKTSFFYAVSFHLLFKFMQILTHILTSFCYVFLYRNSPYAPVGCINT